MSLLTFTTLAAVVYGVLSKRYGRALALGGATPAGAAIVVGDVAVPTFYAVAIGAAALLAVSAFRRSTPGIDLPAGGQRRSIPGVSLLVAFLAWTTMVTLLAPLLFDGLQTVTPGHDILRAGTVTTSNTGQIVYLALGIAVVVFLARRPDAGPQVIGLAVGLPMILSFWRLLSTWYGVPFPEGVFDNSPSLIYIETAPGGVPRFRGIFSEPSALAGSALVAVTYLAFRAAAVRGTIRIGCIVLIALTVFMGVVSTSTTFVVAGVAILAIIGTTVVFSFFSRRSRPGAGAGIVVCILVIVAVFVLPAIGNAVAAVVQDKIGSASYDERSSADADSYGVFLDTLGFGAGLGSGRASSFVPTLLSTAGVVGTLLLAAAVAIVVLRALPSQRLRPVLWALVALLVVKAVSGPDLSDPTGVFWMSLGLLAGGAAGSRPERMPRFETVRRRPGPARQTVRGPLDEAPEEPRDDEAQR